MVNQEGSFWSTTSKKAQLAELKDCHIVAKQLTERVFFSLNQPYSSYSEQSWLFFLPVFDFKATTWINWLTFQKKHTGLFLLYGKPRGIILVQNL